ncbi:protein takeout-like [Tenebrio molitor]|uniref:protein takeout-like n=1 Tax=Tenebrio molitor TaxID=7067 RepID=UPI00362499C7
MKVATVLSLGIFLGVCGGVSLPKYIKLCRGSDPDFDKCGLRNGKEAIKHLVAGDKALRLVPLSPLKLPFIQLENRADFQLNLTDVQILGLDKAELIDFHADLDQHNIRTIVHLAEITVNGDLHADGRVLILPIKGDGPGSIKAYGGNYTFDFHYDLVRKDGREFAKIGKHDFSFSVKKATFDVEKTFGDSIIGKETNKFLNENWSEVIKDFEKVIGYTIGAICKNIASSVFETVPYDEFILP